MNILLKSKAFWTALVSFVGVVVMRYTQVPPEIWQSFVAFALVIVGIFCVDEVGVSIGKSMTKALLDYRESEKLLELQSFKG